MASAVLTSPDFRRVLGLPRVTHTDEHLAELAALITDRYRTPHGTMALRPIQAHMIAAAHDAGGLFAMAPVGSGKTIPSFLIPEVMGAKRPVLLIKAALRDKTLDDLTEVGQHFKTHPNIKLLSYEMLGQPQSQEILDALRPDMIIADEAQALKNLNATRTRRFMRFMADAAPVTFIALSGTMTRRALRDYWHLMCLALPDGGAPLPYRESVMETWGDCLDAKIDSFRRLHPGVLLQLDADAPRDHAATPLDRARRGFHQRMVQTLGVVSATGSSCDTPLTLRKRPIEAPALITDALRDLRNTWTAPNGDELDSTLEVWRHARQLACGFFSVWDPPAPDPWLAARKAWHRFVRGVLAENDPHTDSPFLVARAYADHPLHRAWVDVRDTFEPNSVPVWVDDFLIQDAAAWLHDTGGIAWVEHVTVGEKLAALAGVRYFGGGPAAGRDIGHAQGPIVCSIAAHSVGRNLQRYSANLLVSCPPSGSALEQLIGRTHRYGQPDPVDVDTYLHCEELRDGLLTAFDDARYIQATTGNDQKLLLATREGIHATS